MSDSSQPPSSDDESEEQSEASLSDEDLASESESDHEEDFSEEEAPVSKRPKSVPKSAALPQSKSTAKQKPAVKPKQSDSKPATQRLRPLANIQKKSLAGSTAVRTPKMPGSNTNADASNAMNAAPAYTSPEVDPAECEASQQRRQDNIAAMLGGSLQLQRHAILPKLLNVENAQVCLRKPFKTPHPNAPDCSKDLRHRLLMRKRFVPWGSSSPLPVLTSLKPMPVLKDEQEQKAVELSPEIEPLILWEPAEGQAGSHVEVDSMLTQFLRPHQREGVQFMFECVAGLRPHGGQGCILADDMGLGKTLQGLTLLWTMLNSGHEDLGGNPMAKRVIICCPTSLVNNWDSECTKWLKGRVKTLPLCESSREDVVMSIQQFISPRNPFQVMIVSYETFRIHADKFQVEGTCDLLICDEAHRLKNDQTLTNKALASLACKRRVLLSGTPLQNHLDEFYAMVNFCNPGVLGSPSEFRKHFESPILQGREPHSTADEAQLGLDRSAELSGIVNDFILRRTNALLSAHLPPKVIEVVCCRLTDLQMNLYNHFLASNAARSLLAGKKSARVLSAITALKKLCNHPKLIYDTIHGKASEAAEGFEGCSDYFSPGVFDDGRAGRGGMCEGWEMLSGKFAVVALMLAKLRKETNDRIVIVSNYTQTLDLFQTLCRNKQYPCVRLDGSTSLSKRQKLVVAFNDPNLQQFVFLLSSKAGGCGLNLIGGNRLVLFDPDWNPANDKQAAGRVWRDGQKKRVFVYRFLSTGTIEEKVYQRQLSKEGLQNVVNNDASAKGSAPMSAEELRDLFTLRSTTASDTHDSICCVSDSEGSENQLPDLTADRCIREQSGAPAEEDLKNWGQHSGPATVPDDVLQRIGTDLPGVISFVFTCQVAGKAIEEEKKSGPSPEQIATGCSSLALKLPPGRQSTGPSATRAAAAASGRPSGLGQAPSRSMAGALHPGTASATPSALSKEFKRPFTDPTSCQTPQVPGGAECAPNTHKRSTRSSKQGGVTGQQSGKKGISSAKASNAKVKEGQPSARNESRAEAIADVEMTDNKENIPEVNEAEPVAVKAADKSVPGPTSKPLQTSQGSAGVPFQGGGFRRGGIRGLAAIPENTSKQQEQPAKRQKAAQSVPAQAAKRASAQKAAKTVMGTRITRDSRSPTLVNAAVDTSIIYDSSEDDQE